MADFTGSDSIDFIGPGDSADLAHMAEVIYSFLSELEFFYQVVYKCRRQMDIVTLVGVW